MGGERCNKEHDCFVSMSVQIRTMQVDAESNNVQERSVCMKQMVVVALGVLAAVSLTSSAIAAEGQAKKGEGSGPRLERFKKADTNNDGKLSFDEFKAAFPKGDSEKRFAAADTDKDGFLTPEELKAAHAKKPAKPDAKADDKPAK